MIPATGQFHMNIRKVSVLPGIIAHIWGHGMHGNWLSRLFSCTESWILYFWFETEFAVQSLSCVWPFTTLWTAAHQASVSFSVSLSWLKLMSIESVTPSNHIIICRPLLLLPPILPNISQVAEVLELQLQHQSFQGIFRIDFPQDCLVWSPCCPRDSQESSLTLQF